MEPCTVGRRQIGLRLNRSVSQTRGRARQRYSVLGLIMLSAAETYGIVRGGLARRRSSLQRGIHGSDAEPTRRAAAMHGSPYDEYFQRRNERETRYYYNPRRDERTLKLRRIYFIKRS